MSKKYQLNINNIINEISTGKYDQHVDMTDFNAIKILEIISSYCDFPGSMLMQISFEDLDRVENIVNNNTTTDNSINMKELSKAEHLKKIFIGIKNEKKANKEDLF